MGRAHCCSVGYRDWMSNVQGGCDRGEGKAGSEQRIQSAIFSLPRRSGALAGLMRNAKEESGPVWAGEMMWGLR